jgi:hypothetical protein
MPCTKSATSPARNTEFLLLGEDSHDEQGEREAAAPWQIGSDAGVGRAAERGEWYNLDWMRRFIERALCEAMVDDSGEEDGQQLPHVARDARWCRDEPNEDTRRDGGQRQREWGLDSR